MGKIVVKNFVVVFSDAKCDAVLEPVIIFVLGLGGGGMGDDWRMGGGGDSMVFRGPEGGSVGDYGKFNACGIGSLNYHRA